MNSDTPRTDALLMSGKCYIDSVECDPVINFARQMERELAAAQLQMAADIAFIKQLGKTCAAAKKEAIALRKDAERLNWIFENGCGVRRKYNARQNLVCWVEDGRPYIDRKMREEVEQRASLLMTHNAEAVRPACGSEPAKG